MILFTPFAHPEYAIDLELEERRRWDSVIARDKAEAAKICRLALREFKGSPGWVFSLFGALFQGFGPIYVEELNAWARAIGVTFGQLAAVNCSYEFSHIGGSPFPRMIGRAMATSRFWKSAPAPGCTAGVLRALDGRLLHVRTLDWPLPGMGPATRVFRFRRGAHQFIVVGFPGMVGALSGMVPGSYSVTIDWAPPTHLPNFHYGPTFLLREVLETCPTYESVIARLAATKLSTSVFFTVCGCDSACVIERTRDDCAIRPFTGPALTQANHFVHDKFTKWNGQGEDSPEKSDDAVLRTTRRRAELLASTLDQLHLRGAGSLPEALHALHPEPVTNEQTMQRMAFCPATGEYALECRVVEKV